MRFIPSSASAPPGVFPAAHALLTTGHFRRELGLSSEEVVEMPEDQRPRRTAKRSPNDPTLVRNQPALTTAHGTEWIIVGAIFVLISGVVLFLLRDRGPAGLALGAIAVITACYLGMVVVRFAVQTGRLRLGLLAALLGAIALLSLIVVLVIAAAESPSALSG